jgi:hypothetical protein
VLRLAPRAMRRGFFLAVRWRIRWEPVQPTVLSRAVGVFSPQSDGPTQRILMLLVSRSLRLSALRQMETATRCAAKYSSKETGVGCDRTGGHSMEYPNAQDQHHRTCRLMG